MKVDREDRIGPAPAREGSRVGLLLTAAVCAAGFGALAIPSWGDLAQRGFRAAEQAVGLAPSQDAFAAVYQRLGVSSLPARAFASGDVAASLARLSRDPCDRGAIAALGGALVAAGETRLAAESLSGFARSCANAGGEGYQAGQLFLELGDAQKAVAAADALLGKNPAEPSFHYLRGKALSASGRGEEAVAEYKNAIALSRSPRDVGEWVFVELANLFATLGRPCEAAQTIVAWVAIDPAARDTLRARKLIADYSAGGCRSEAAPAAKDL
jgi:tetratricopeptide (TPR) repeat protein